MSLSEKEPSLSKVIHTLVLRIMPLGQPYSRSSLRGPIIPQAHYGILYPSSLSIYSPLPPSAVPSVKDFLSTVGEPYLSHSANMMKALRFHGQRDIRLDDVEIVQCGRDQVKVGAVPSVQVPQSLDPKCPLSGKTSFRGYMWNRYAAAPVVPCNTRRLMLSFQTCMSTWEVQVSCRLLLIPSLRRRYH